MGKSDPGKKLALLLNKHAGRIIIYILKSFVRWNKDTARMKRFLVIK